MTQWLSTDVAKALAATVSGSWQACRVSIDSRIVQPGDIYVALKGERLDGHDFIAEALSKGAVAAIAQRPLPTPLPRAGEGSAPLGAQGEGNIIIVPNTYRALEQLGAFARARFKGRVVGLTGSVGKTTTKEMLRIALSAYGETFASFGNFNNHIGTPLNLANLPEDAAFGVFEMGMNHAGEITKLTKQVKPEIAIITNVEAVHLEFFKSIEDIADAKAEIFEGLTPGGTAILNADNAQFERLVKRTQERVMTFGTHKADIQLSDISYIETGMCLTVNAVGEAISHTLNAIGQAPTMASLAALATVHALKLPLAPAAAALANFTEGAGRGNVRQITKNGLNFWLLDDAYNASPASMIAAFQKMATLRKVKPNIGRLVAVLGDMLELGERENALHAGLVQPIQEAGIDLVITAGSRMEHLHHALPKPLQGGHLASVDALKVELLNHLKPNDLVLVKGSHGSYMYKLVEYLTQG